MIIATDAGYCQDYSPNLQEIYSFPIGSEFQYRITKGGEPPYQEVQVERYTVTDKWVNGDTLFYSRLGVFEYTRYVLYPVQSIEDQYTGIINDSVFIIDSTRHCLNACAGELVCVGLQDCYSFIIVENSEKIIGGENNLFVYNENDSLESLDNSNPLGLHFKQVFKEGAGLQLKSQGDVMHYTITQCEGSLINGVRTGIHSLTSDLSFDDHLHIYPNIIQENEKINIESATDYLDLFIVSSDGKVMPLAQKNKDYIILDGLPKGMYFLTFVFKDHNTTRRVFKQ